MDIGQPQTPSHPASIQVQSNNFTPTQGSNITSGNALTAGGSSAGAGAGAGVQNKLGKDPRIDELVRLLGEHMPHGDQNSPYSQYLSQFMSLRLMLLKPTRSQHEKDNEATLLSSYSSYKASGRDACDIAIMIARDYMFLQQQAPTPHPAPQQQQQQQNLNFYGQQQQPQNPIQFNQQQLQGSGNGAPQAMDISNHSVIGLGQAPGDRASHHGSIPDVSNHSHGPIGHPPNAA